MGLKYEVKLFETFFLTFNKDGNFTRNDTLWNAKFYLRPKQRLEESGNGTEHKCEEDNSLKNYGFVQRVKKRNEKKKSYTIIPRYEFKIQEKWNDMLANLISSHYEETSYPQVFSNLSCLVAMMVPSQRSKFKAWRMVINKTTGDYVIRVKLLSSSTSERDESSYGMNFEYQTQAPPLRYNGASSENSDIVSAHDGSSAKCEPKEGKEPEETINLNEILETFYGATLNIDNETLSFAFFAETDGLWNWTGSTSTPSKDDIVEVKSIDKANLTSRTFYFEETKLREYYAGCAIRGITQFICNYVENEILQEQWLYSVENIPAVVETCSKKKDWNRAFPQDVCNEKCNEKLKVWNREDCFKSLGSCLRTIISAVKKSEKPYYFFIRNDPRKLNLIKEISEKEYEELEMKERQLVLHYNFNRPSIDKVKTVISKPIETTKFSAIRQQKTLDNYNNSLLLTFNSERESIAALKNFRKNLKESNLKWTLSKANNAQRTK